MKSLEIDNKEYQGKEAKLSQLTPQLLPLLSDNQNTILKAPTGAGKTYFFLHDFAEYYSDKRITLLAPVQILVDNISKDYKDVKELSAGYGRKWASKVDSRLIVTTYDSFPLTELPDVVIIDEAHEFGAAASYRRDALEKILKLDCKIIYLSATPDVLYKWRTNELDEFNHYKALNKIEVSYRQPEQKSVKIINTSKGIEELAHRLIGCKDDSKLLWLRINDKDLITKLYEDFKERYNVAMYFSAEKNHDGDTILTQCQPELTKRLKKGVIPEEVEILLTTSITDAGLTAEVYRDVDAHALNVGNMPNPFSMIQFAARVRGENSLGKTHKLELTIYGTFAEGYRDTMSIINYSGLTNKQVIEDTGHHYNKYNDLNEEAYLEVLESHNIEPFLIDDTTPNKPKRYASKERKLTIAKNLPAFYNHYDQVEGMAKRVDRTDWLQWFNQDTELLFIDNNAEAHRVREIFLNAFEFGIHPELFATERPDAWKLVGNLTSVIERFKANRSFKKVVFQLLDGIDKDSYKMPLKDYHELQDADKKLIKKLSSLIYSGRIHKDRKTVELKRIDNPHGLYFIDANFTVDMIDAFNFEQFCLDTLDNSMIEYTKEEAEELAIQIGLLQAS
ncbi:MAG: hypothetical protein DCO96_06570 [Fluviicola sp. XM-24bin1]|nr:MAG: hypothetical protein DCO96_06570 [Fluviicola sp. XM-24bin1]